MPEKNSSIPADQFVNQPKYVGEVDDEISLTELISNLWYYRKFIVVLSLSAVVIIAAVATWIYLKQQNSKVVSLEFKLDFEGADKNEYPNGLRFSTADILSTPVLSEVYKENDLKEYFEFAKFKAGLTIFQTNDELKFLEYEYAEKLRKKDLSLEERDRLEAEFLEKKKTGLLPIYTLLFRYNEKMNSIPEKLIAKMLNDILRIWANHADRVKGANKYQYSLVSRNTLSEKDLQNEDYFIATDMLRTTVQRISDDIEKLQQIPGARTTKVGANAIGLRDLQFRMEDIQQFRLSPLIGLIRQSGISKDTTVTLGYLRNRLFELNLKQEEAAAKVAVYENSLNQYIQRSRAASAALGGDSELTPSLKQGLPGNVPVMIPQLGASFLDSLIEMAQENSDMLFRQEISGKLVEAGLRQVDITMQKKYYQELYNKISFKNGKTDIHDNYQKSALERIQRTHKEIYNLLLKTIDEVNAIYLDLSRYNLNPESVLFSLTKPVTTASMKSLTPRKTFLYVIIASVFAVAAIVIGGLLICSFTTAKRI